VGIQAVRPMAPIALRGAPPMRNTPGKRRLRVQAVGTGAAAGAGRGLRAQAVVTGAGC